MYMCWLLGLWTQLPLGFHPWTPLRTCPQDSPAVAHHHLPNLATPSIGYEDKRSQIEASIEATQFGFMHARPYVRSWNLNSIVAWRTSEKLTANKNTFAVNYNGICLAIGRPATIKWSLWVSDGQQCWYTKSLFVRAVSDGPRQHGVTVMLTDRSALRAVVTAHLGDAELMRSVGNERSGPADMLISDNWTLCLDQSSIV